MDQSAIRIFPSKLGWMVLRLAEDKKSVQCLSFGHASSVEAERDVWNTTMACPVECMYGVDGGNGVACGVRYSNSEADQLVRRLQAYAAGAADDFCDIPIDFRGLTEFSRSVLTHCRKIPYGTTITYAELARRAGRPGAARAVGNCMALNRTPLLVPCHRVIRADGGLGEYSGPGGTRTKRRLVKIEAATGRSPVFFKNPLHTAYGSAEN